MRRAGCRRSTRDRLCAYHGRIKLVPLGFSHPPQRSISWPSRCTAGLCRFACNCSPVSRPCSKRPRTTRRPRNGTRLSCSTCASTPTCSRWSGRCGRGATTPPAPARVPGVRLPSLPDQDNSFAEIQSRIDKVIDCLKALRPDQIDGKDDAKVTVTIGGQPQELSGQNYLYHFANLPVQVYATEGF